MHFLYLITNTKNSKVYVGQTKNPAKRKSQHKNQSTNKHLRNAIAKYGWDSFMFEVIAVSLTQDDADRTEQLLITQYDSRNQSMGYNVSPGGYYLEMSDEIREKMANAKRGRKLSDETKRKISISLQSKQCQTRFVKGQAAINPFKKGQSPWNKGIKHSEETKTLISMAGKGRTPPNKMSNEKEELIVSLYKDGKTYREIMDMANCGETSIMRVINRKNIEKRMK